MVFFKSLICCALIVGIASAAPQHRIFRRAAPNPAASGFSGNPQEIVITSYSNEIDPATGSFQYGYQQSDGSVVSAKGYINPNGQQVIEGSYSFVDKNGNPVQIQYLANENGYQAVGDAIPTPDPIIAKAVAYIKSLPPSPENNKQ